MFNSKTVNIFIWFSPVDRELRKELDSHLYGVSRLYQIKVWDEDELGAGVDEQEIFDNLEESDIILLLISSDLFNHKLFEAVMEAAARRRATGTAEIVVVLLRQCGWEDIPFGQERLGDLVTLPADRRQVSSRDKDYRDQAFKDVVAGLKGLMEKKGRRVSIAPIPELLPYMCDRSRQEGVLKKRIDEWRASSSSSSRPFVLIVHGNIDECHEMFRRRLAEVTLPKLLWPDKNLTIDSQLLELPEEYINYKEPFEFLGSTLGSRAASNPEASVDEIRRAIKKPLMFYSLMGSENWETEGRRMVEAYLDFWNALPDMPPERVFACLLVSYRNTGEFAQKYREANRKAHEFLENFERRGGWRTALETETPTNGESGWLRLLKGLSWKRQLSEEPASYEKIYGGVLPELTGIRLKHVEAWISNSDYFSGFCKNHPRAFCDIQAAILAAETMFAKEKAEEIPMCPLAKKLEELIKENCCERRV